MTNSQPLPTKCANLLCLNEVGQGSFMLVSINGVMLLMCTPCALKLQGSTSKTPPEVHRS